MTNAGGFRPKDAVSRITEQERLLGQIAESVNLPVSIFRRPRAAATAKGPTASECTTLLAAFSRIRDPDVRRQCLATVERCAEGNDEAGPAVRSRT